MVFNTIVPVCPPRQAKPSASSLFCFFLFFLFFVFLFFPCGFFYDVDGDMDTRTIFDDFLMKEILAGRFDDFLTTIFLFKDLSGRRTSRYRRRPDFSLLPRCLFWSSGHTPAPGAPG